MSIADTITNYIRTQLTAETRAIGLDCNLTQDGRLDSTAMLELILWVGDTFNIAIQSDDLTPENFATPRHIVEFVERHRNALVPEVHQDTPANVGTD
jgi:acyl carrier protein